MSSSILSLFRRAWRKSRRDDTAFVAAGLSFFTLFSLVPVSLLAVTVAGGVWGHAAASGALVSGAATWMGPDTARFLAKALDSAQRPGAAGWASLVAVIFGASALFYNLRHALNLQWGLDLRRNVRGAVVSRLAAFSMVLVVGLFMVVFFGVHAALAALWRLWGPYVPVPGRVWAWKLTNTGASLVFLGVLFAVVYRVLPAVRLRWKEALIGGAVTSGLVTAANQLIGLYFRFARFKSLYGAGAAVLVVLLWVYLSAQVFLFGAEFTWALARRKEEDDAQEGEKRFDGGTSREAGRPA